MSNFLILTSCGITPVINSTLSGIAEVVKNYKKSLFRATWYKWCFDNRIINLTNFSKSKISHMLLCSYFIGIIRLKNLPTKNLKIK